MSATKKLCIIEDMLAQLALGRQSMEAQGKAIADIMDKSNNVLLQIEATQVRTPTTATNARTTAAVPYSFNKETVQALAKMVERFQELLSNSERNTAASENSPNFEEYLQQTRQRTEYLDSSVRKLLAASSTISRMETNLQDQELLNIDIVDTTSSEEI